MFEDKQLINAIAASVRPPLTKVADIAIPLPRNEIRQRPWLVGRTIRFQLLPPFDSTQMRVQVADQEGVPIFTFGGKDLQPRSAPKWHELLAYVRYMSQKNDEDSSDDE